MRCLIKNQVRIKGPTETISKIWNVHFRGHISNLGRTLDFDTIKPIDRKSTRLNSSHLVISYAVFCLKKKKNIYIHN